MKVLLKLDSSEKKCISKMCDLCTRQPIREIEKKKLYLKPKSYQE